MVNTTIVSRVFLLHSFFKDMLSFLEYIEQRELDLDDIAVKYEGFYETDYFGDLESLNENVSLNPQTQKIYQALKDAIELGKSHNNFPIEVFSDIETKQTGRKVLFRVNAGSTNRKDRMVVLKFISDQLKDKFTIKEYNLNTGANARLDVDKVALIVVKPMAGGEKTSSTAYNLHDYIPTKMPTTSEIVEAGENAVKTLVFKNANQMRRYVLARVETNPKFNMTQREIIRNAFNINSIGETIPDLQYDPKLLVSFGEILVPYLILKGKYQVRVSGTEGKIYNYLNTNAKSRSVHYPDSANYKKIDYFIDYNEGKNLFGRVKVSAKYGKGHAVNVASLLPQTYDDVITKSVGKPLNSDDIFTKLYKIAKATNKIKVPELYWSYYIPKIKLDGKNYTGIELFNVCKGREIKQESDKTLKEDSNNQWETFDNELKQFIRTHYGDTSLNWDRFDEAFPHSISYLFSVRAKEDFYRDDVAQHNLKTVIGDCPYFQVRISAKDAEKGRFDFTMIETNKSRKVEFHVNHSMTDIAMRKGSLGYIIS